MKSKIDYYLITGEKAYAIWYIYNDFEIDMRTMLAVDQNLELIMGSTGEVYAYRSNLPLNIAREFGNNGAWEYTEEAGLLFEDDLQRLKLICRNYAFN